MGGTHDHTSGTKRTTLSRRFRRRDADVDAAPLEDEVVEVLEAVGPAAEEE